MTKKKSKTSIEFREEEIRLYTTSSLDVAYKLLKQKKKTEITIEELIDTATELTVKILINSHALLQQLTNLSKAEDKNE